MLTEYLQGAPLATAPGKTSYSSAKATCSRGWLILLWIVMGHLGWMLRPEHRRSLLGMARRLRAETVQALYRRGIQVAIVLLAIPDAIFWRCAAWRARLQTMLANQGDHDGR